MKISRTGIIKKLDKIVGDIVKLRDISCVTCGHGSNLTPGHLFSRVALSTRWDLDNVFCQCVRCNGKHEENPEPLKTYAVNLLGKNKVEELEFKWNHAVHWKVHDLVELYEKLEKELKEYAQVS